MQAGATTRDWPDIAVVGAGAVGCYFGGLLARVGASVTLIGRPGHVQAITTSGLRLETLAGDWSVPIAATTDLSAVRDAQIVLFCVKTPDTEGTARELVSHLAPAARVLSLQNGVDNVERMHGAAGIPAFAAAVYVAVQMVGPGHVKHTGRGDLAIGDVLAAPGAPSRSAEVSQLADLFHRAGIPCRVAQDIRVELWTKLVMNCAYNGISALTGQRYGVIAHDEKSRELIERIIEETAAVAGALGVALPVEPLMVAAARLGAEAMPDALSSTAQDLLGGKRTEIDSLNGYVSRLGDLKGVETPANDTVYALVKLAEEVRGFALPKPAL